MQIVLEAAGLSGQKKILVPVITGFLQSETKSYLNS